MVGPNVIGAALALILAGVGYLIIPEVPFLTVHELKVSPSGQVTTIRTVRGESRLADWRVTILEAGSDSPVCQTKPGPDIHEGWSRYEPGWKVVSIMDLDTWVGDSNCIANIAATHAETDVSEYVQYVTWSPRDGTAPVAARTTFTIDMTQLELDE